MEDTKSVLEIEFKEDLKYKKIKTDCIELVSYENIDGKDEKVIYEIYGVKEIRGKIQCNSIALMKTDKEIRRLLVNVEYPEMINKIIEADRFVKFFS